MIVVEDAFARLLGRQPTDVERQTLLRTRDALGLRNNDALWLVLIAVGHYETLYGALPERIARAAADVTERAKLAAEAELKATAARTCEELATSVAKTVQKIAGRLADANLWRARALALGVAAAVFVGVGASMYRVGHDAGEQDGQRKGYETARDEKAADAWANTPEGQLGYALAKAGSLREVATCTGKPFVRHGRECFVRPSRDPAFGWKLAP